MKKVLAIVVLALVWPAVHLLAVLDDMVIRYDATDLDRDDW